MKFRKIKESRKLANEVSGWDLEDEDIELANSEECGDNLYLVKLWWGSGYMLDCYNAYAFSEEEALDYVVAHIEKTHPEWLESSDECANALKEEYDEDSIEFQETFMYVDATTEGASEPHYIYSENLAIEKYPKSHNYPKSKEISESALEINPPSEKQQEFNKLMKSMMDAEDAVFSSIMQVKRMLRYERNPSLIKALKGFLSNAEKSYEKISDAKLKIRGIEVNESFEDKYSVEDLTPSNGRKSFGGKAKVVSVPGWKLLYSYHTLIAGIDEDGYGKVHRFSDDTSMTTRTHIQSFLDYWHNVRYPDMSAKDFYKKVELEEPQEDFLHFDYWNW